MTNYRRAQLLMRIVELLKAEARTSEQLRASLEITEDEPPTLRTLQRCLKSLEDEQQIRVDRRTRPPVYSLSTALKPVEALVTHSALRLLHHHAPGYNAVYASALAKLAELLPQPAREIARQSTDERRNRRLDAGEALSVVAQGWFNRQPIAFSYLKPGGSGRPRHNVLEVYLVEVSRTNLGLYVIGHERAYHQARRTFKLDRMQGVRLVGEPRSYDIPESFNARQYLSNAWGVVGSDGSEPVQVRVRFKQSEAYRLREAGYPDFEIVEMPDKGIEVRFLAGTDRDGFPLELLSWVQSWGSRITVLEPYGLRQRWLAEARAVAGTGEGE